MSKNVVKHFPCQVKPTNQLLRGLGGMEIRSESFVTLPVEFSDITIEIDFYVVGGNNLSVPVIIGTDVLNRKGITYVRTGDSQRIIHSEATVNDILQVNLISLSDQVNTSVFGNNRERLLEILTKYSDFFLSGTATTTVKDSEMHIKLTTDVPVYYRPYKLSHGEKLKVRTIVKDLLDKGIIRESDSEYASPILLVKKKDGSDRMVVDYRALNRITVKTRYPLPLINDYIDRLGNGRWFSSLDMVSGFHQLRVAEESIHKTAFVTPEAQYEYCKVPYGLANAPIFYQKTISKTLKSFIDAGKVMVYIDDVLIMTVGIDEHLVLLDSVMKTLTETGFSINLKKCTFVTNEIEYLVSPTLQVATTSRTTSTPGTSTQSMENEIAELKAAVKNLTMQWSRRSRPCDRSSIRNRRRSTSRSDSSYRRYPTCWYHSKYGDKANRCIKPCDFGKSGNARSSR
ncbi:unnamed protein product [Parnassius mnemosyne]|uniref:Reverse transcriptase domain-containing protein n=1 Tax=Parnassius mnemosyne TaxID=213953 RepID=A0AAV1LB81_9NEOP